MQGVFYLLSIIAVFIVIVSYIRNDNVGDDQPITGLLATKTPESKNAPAKSRRPKKWRKERDN